MRFRPEDQYCKPAVARAKKSSCLVLKVKRRRKLNNGVRQTDGDSDTVTTAVEGSGADRLEGGDGKDEWNNYSAELLGVANTVYTFPGNFVSQDVIQCYVCDVHFTEQCMYKW